MNDSRREWTPTELIAVAEAPGRVGPPGGPHHYSNTNYIVLGEVGALLSTDRDLLTFADALAHGTMLSPDSQAAMHAFVPAEDLSQFGIAHGYGLGLEQYVTDTVTVICHLGTGESQSGFFGYDTQHGTAVAVMTNTAVAGPQAIMGLEALTAATKAG